MEFTSFQLQYSTLDDELSSAPTFLQIEFDLNSIIPAGVYRVIDGEMCRIIGLELPNVF